MFLNLLAATGGSPARPTSRRASAPQTPTTPADDVVKSKKLVNFYKSSINFYE